MTPPPGAPMLPQALQLRALGAELRIEVETLDRRISEALALTIAVSDEIGRVGHKVRNLEAPIAVLLDELERLFPIPDPPAGTS